MSDVGVLVIARNAASTIGTALAGIAGQSRRPAEVLVVDDGSTDGTAAVAERWRDDLPVRVERLLAPTGVGGARRHGVEALDRPLIAQLDADDYWLTDHLRVMTDAHEPGRLVFARDLLWCPGSWLRASERSLPDPAGQLGALYEGNLSSAGVLFERDAYVRAGGYRASLPASEDWDLYLRMVRQGAVMALAAEPTLLYRVSPDSTSAGYKTAASDVAVLEHALDEATNDAERAAARAALRQRRARLSLARALEAAAAGRSGEARASARRALRDGDGHTRTIAASLLIAPRTAASTRAAVSRRRRTGGA